MDWLQTLLDNSTTPADSLFIRSAYSPFTLSVSNKYSCYRFYRKRY